jgi:hypothetical protein
MAILLGSISSEFEELTLLTKRRRQIRNEFGHPQKLQAAIEAAHSNFKSLPFGDRIIRRSTSTTYNCCGLVFASRRTSIDPEDLEMVREDEYRVIPENEVLPGDVVIYRDETSNIVHVGVLLEKRLSASELDDHLLVLSQWGFYGEYIHLSKDVPPGFGAVSEFWTERND